MLGVRSLSLLFIIPLLLAGWASSQHAGNGSMTLAVESSIPTFDCWFSSDTQCIILSKLWGDTLVNHDPDDPARLVPGLATDWEYLNDQMLRMELRKGVVFHNGEPFNAEAVKTTLEYVADPDNQAVLRYGVSWLGEVEVIDDYTIILHYTAPNASGIQRLAQFGTIYPPSYYLEAGPEGFGAAPVGTGPYRLVRWDRDQAAVFEANPDYFGGSKGMPRLERLVVRFMPEQSTRIAELLAGTIDVASEVAPDQTSLLEATGLEIYPVQTNALVFINFDSDNRTGDSAFTNRLVRQAVAHAIDKEGLVNDILGGFAEPAHAMATKFMSGFSDDVTRYEYDPERARALLAEAGAQDIRLEFVSWIPQRQALEAVVGYLRAAGVDAQLRYLGSDPARGAQMELAGELSFYASLWTTIFDADAILCPYHCPDNPRQYTEDPEIGAWLAEAASTVDPEVRAELLRQSLQRISEEAYMLPLFSPQIVFGMQPGVDFVDVDAPDYPRYFNLGWK